jgi:hypothetical protein
MEWSALQTVKAHRGRMALAGRYERFSTACRQEYESKSVFTKSFVLKKKTPTSHNNIVNFHVYISA